MMVNLRSQAIAWLVLVSVGIQSINDLYACTLWGAAGDEAGGGTILSKNRDWKPDHVQVLRMRRDAGRFAYFGLYAEGNDAEGIKAGVNEKGLSVMTATAGAIPKPIRSAQTGKGGLMGQLLANYASCDDVLADEEKLFRGRRPVFMLIADRDKIIVLEVGLEGRYAMRVVESGVVTHTNHFLDESLQDFNLQVSESSAARARRIGQLLASATKPCDMESFVAMSRDRNDGPRNSLWRTGGSSRTLSSWIIETPRRGHPRLRVTIANPAEEAVTHDFELDDQFWRQTPTSFTAQPAHSIDSPAKAQAATGSPKTTQCEGTYPGHLQGICTDEHDAIFWSWTDTLVKTDSQGRMIQSIKVASHHGDLCYRDGRVYVAVNLGRFNRPAGEADSWIYVYDSETLEELSRHPVPELVHGAGGIAWGQGRFIVVGGLPEGTDQNYLYEYDEDFTFQQRHVLPTGYTRMGIQTATYADGHWWFGCYGTPRVLLRTDEAVVLTGQWEFDAALGIVAATDGTFLIGQNKGNKRDGYRGGAIRVQANEQSWPPLATPSLR